jgi:hypothetical protein
MMTIPQRNVGGTQGLPPDMHHSGWRVVSQLTDQVIVTAAGQAITGVQIFFITGDGNEGSIFVANNHYTLKAVKPLIHAAAAQIDTVGVLASGAL